MKLHEIGLNMKLCEHRLNMKLHESGLNMNLCESGLKSEIRVKVHMIFAHALKTHDGSFPMVC